MPARDWLHNARGEWYVLGQAVLSLTVLLAPRADGTLPSLTTGAMLAGAVLGAAGLALVLLGSAKLGRSLSPFPRPRDQGRLVETGVFALVRHPIYTGMTLLAVGWSVA